MEHLNSPAAMDPTMPLHQAGNFPKSLHQGERGNVLAVDVCRLWAAPLSALTPMCAFMRKNQLFPCLVDDNSESPALIILGRGWRVDDRFTHQRARAQGDVLVRHFRVHVRKECLGQPVPLQKMSKVKENGLVRNAVVTQLDAGKAADRLAVVERLFGLNCPL